MKKTIFIIALLLISDSYAQIQVSTLTPEFKGVEDYH